MKGNVKWKKNCAEIPREPARMICEPASPRACASMCLCP